MLIVPVQFTSPDLLNKVLARLKHKGTSIYLFRSQITALGGARNPHVRRVHSGFSAPSALSSDFSQQYIEVPTREKERLD